MRHDDQQIKHSSLLDTGTKSLTKRSQACVTSGTGETMVDLRPPASRSSPSRSWHNNDFSDGVVGQRKPTNNFKAIINDQPWPGP